MSAHAPYSASVWKEIHACGDAVEVSLRRSGVALTMGGEPTFVPTIPDGAEWQTAALGPTKLTYARQLAHALIRTAYPGSVILETSGKHYPGEPLPRWALLVQHRADGHPLWQDPSLLAADTKVGHHTLAQAKKFLAGLAGSLAVDTRHSLPLVEAAAPESPVGYVLPLDHPAAWVTDKSTA